MSKNKSELSNELNNIKEILEDSNIYIKAHIQKELKQLKTSNPETYSYCTTFISTMRNCITAYLNINTGIVQANNTSSAVEDMAKYGATQAASIGTEIGTKVLESTSVAVGAIPFIGGFASMAANGIIAVIDGVKTSQNKNKIKAIADVISSDDDFDMHRKLNIQLSVLEIIKSENKLKQIKNPGKETSGLVTNIMHAVYDKLAHVKDKVLKNKQIESSPQQDLAIQDALGVFASMYENYEQFKAKKYGENLYQQISKVVLDNGLESVIKSALETDAKIIASIETKIDLCELENIRTKAKNGLWKKTPLKSGKEVSEYLEDSYLQDWLGKKLIPAEVDAARMVVFKHICTGIKEASRSDRNYECATKFAEEYPGLIKSMAAQYPDFFVSKTVARKLLEREETLKTFVVKELKKKSSPLTTIRTTVNKEDLEIIEAKLDASKLKDLREKAEKGLWKETWMSWGKEVEEYLTDTYLKKYLGNKLLQREIDAAKMVIFKHICKAIYAQTKPLDDLMTCASEFAKSYPQLIKTIAQDHPELFISAAIAEKIDQVKDDVKLLTNVKQHFSIIGHGTVQQNSESSYNSYWYEYTKEAMDAILELRLETVKDISNLETKLFSPSYVWDNSKATTEKLCNEISNDLKNTNQHTTLLIPLNLYGKHWVGIAIAKSEEGIKISYMDSENNPIPDILKVTLKEVLSDSKGLEIAEVKVPLQHYDNCGPETIENLIGHVSGYRIDEDSALTIHSILVGDTIITEVDENV